MSDTYTLYVLKLEEDDVRTNNIRLYVGITSDYKTRLRQHKSGSGAKCIEGKSVSDHYSLGTVEGRRTAESLENNLTRVMAKEYTWYQVRGGSYVKQKKTNLPKVDDADLSPYLFSALLDTGDEHLERLVKHSRVTLELKDELEFGTIEAAMEWADRKLPDGTEFKLNKPSLKDRKTHTARLREIDNEE